MDLGPTTSVAAWERFQMLSEDWKKQFLLSLRGVFLMFEQIQQAFKNSQRKLNLANTYTWYGLFSSLGVLIGAQAYANQGQIRFYEVGDGGLLSLVDEESIIY